MSRLSIEVKVEELLKPIIENLDYTLYDVQYVKEAKNYYLRIIIDKEEGISIEDCEKVNNVIDEPLDIANFIDDSYFLEVSSPGIERVLRKDWHFQEQIGNKINVKLFKSIDNQKEFEGILKNYCNDNLEIEIDENNINIDKKNIALVKTVCDIF